MRRITTTFVAFFMALGVANAGGIVTNTNQSAAFVRMPAQDAATGIHAVYHNPAGLTKLQDGFHVHVGNQSIVQTKEIETTYPMNNSTYVGDVNALFFPTVYAAYKKGDWAFSVGVNPIGGGGGAEYKTGLPSFEMPIAALPQIANGYLPTDADRYSADIYFKGSSVFMGVQAGVSYKINEIISVYAGARYVYAQNTYEGHIKNIMIDPTMDLRFLDGSGTNYAGDMVSANTFFNDVSEYFSKISSFSQTQSSVLDSKMTTDPTIATKSLTQAFTDGNLTQEQYETMVGTLAAFSSGTIDQATAAGMPVAQAKGTYDVFATNYTTNSVAIKNGFDENTKDKKVDAKQTGSGFAPILGANISLMEEKLNIGIKYEFKTALEVENDTEFDDVDMFEHGERVPNDLPAMLSVGASYDFTDDFRAAAGVHYYWDKPAKYGKMDAEGENYITNEDLIDKNSYEIAVGLEYDVSEKITLSGGWLTTSTSPTLAYQTDMSYTLSTNTIAFGLQGNITDRFVIDLGAMYTMYQDGEKDFDSSYKEIYRKKTFTAAIGFSYRFGGSASEE